MEESEIENLLNHWEFDIRAHCNCMCSQCFGNEGEALIRIGMCVGAHF
jgi:hypothetical protein